MTEITRGADYETTYLPLADVDGSYLWTEQIDNVVIPRAVNFTSQKVSHLVVVKHRESVF